MDATDRMEGAPTALRLAEDERAWLARRAARARVGVGEVLRGLLEGDARGRWTRWPGLDEDRPRRRGRTRDGRRRWGVARAQVALRLPAPLRAAAQARMEAIEAASARAGAPLRLTLARYVRVLVARARAAETRAGPSTGFLTGPRPALY